MPVVVHSVSGKTQTFQQADAASRKGDWIAVSRWNPQKHRLEAIELLDARDVTVAEVIKHGVLQQIVAGARRREVKHRF